ncbi:MAG TPA: hypothetical protein P5032_03135 [Candidatus Competibacter sp.]|nr:hypothetical protein [Candidatus Competibacter sp.]
MQPAPDVLQAWLSQYPGLQQLLPLLDPNSTDEEFDEALENHILDAVRWLENNADSLHKDSEDSLSTTLAGRIGIKQVIGAHREMNSKGHVDITIKVISTPRQRLGEAKIYKGYAYHEQGMQQLIERYSTGRDRSGYMFCYVKIPDIKGKMEKLRVECDARKPCGQNTGSVGHKEKWVFETRHAHASGEELRVVHFGVNLHVLKWTPCPDNF